MALDKFCSEGATVTDHCRDILKAGIKISELDGEAWQACYKDRRIAGVAAIDAALTWGLTVADTDQLDVPVLLIGLGDRSDRLHATDTSASGSGFELLYPGAQVEVIAPASHFTALGSCKPSGAEILVEEKDDPVCTDPPGTDRKDVMAKIIGADFRPLQARLRTRGRQPCRPLDHSAASTESSSSTRGREAISFLISSATRNDSSSAWAALRRGSQKVW